VADNEQVPIFDFMLLRPATQIDVGILRRKYIHDDVRTDQGRVLVDLQSPNSPSKIGRLIFQKVFCEIPNPAPREALLELRNSVVALLPSFEAQCSNNSVTYPLDIASLQQHAFLRFGDKFYFLPDQLTADADMASQVLAILTGPRSAAGAGFSEVDLFDKLNEYFGRFYDGASLSTIALDGSGGFLADTKRVLFDALYMLYVLRRWASVNFESIMTGLGALHALEALAIDEIYARGLQGPLGSDDLRRVTLLASDFPALRAWDGNNKPVPGFPLIASPADLAGYLAARPIVQPIFAQLYHYAKPFNAIKPLGVGDLKVVKQWLISYEAGEISDIHNVMQGEVKERIHRRLEKTEETFSFSSTASQESTRDTASTDRFEVKREAEQVVKTDLNVNANVRAQYDNKVVLVAVGAGFAYNRSSTDQQKIAQNFSREVVDKAVMRVQTSTVQQRSTTKIFETEETNKHGFTNAPGTGHLSGIYRWVDKRYKAQVFNYGKRMMFEFVLPEPAAFLVESRLRDFEAKLDYPRKPKTPDYKSATLPFVPSDITEGKFNELRLKYDLSAFTYPTTSKTVAFVQQEGGGGFFAEKDLNREDLPYAKSYTCKLEAEGYLINTLHLSGQVTFKDHNEPPASERDVNIVKLSIDGTTLWYEEHSNLIYNVFPYDYRVQVNPPYLLTRSDVDVVLGFQDIERYDLMLGADVTLSPAGLLKWQTAVWNAIAAVERATVDAANRELRLGYDGDMATYRNRIAEIKASAIHDLIQGRSEAYNRDLIMTELRRQCLAMLTKEFDALPQDDLLTDWESMGTRPVTVGYRRLTVDETGTETKIEFTSTPHNLEYPVPILEQARDKGRYIQFLEQAFEWGRLGYVCYSYFWATPPKWIELMNRTDDGDPNLTAFLRAGAVKVLVAATPAYDEAVLHFLATREPWEGGPSPVIGDPLYLPLFEELHRQQDDRYGAVPDGDPWTFTLPTSLVYLHGSTTPLPVVPPITQ
jgi:hypothetical protein